MRKMAGHRFLLGLVILGLVGFPGHASAGEPTPPAPTSKPSEPPPDPKAGSRAAPQAALATLPGIAIEGGSPLTRIGVTPDLNCYVNHADDTVGEFYGDTACATLVAWNGVLYGPNDIPAGSAASPRTAFVPVSQSKTGDGSPSTPWLITTEVRLGSSGMRLVQYDFYVNGEERFRTIVTVVNEGSTPGPLVIYRAGDCFLQDSDEGFGRLDLARGSVACVAADSDGAGGFVPGHRVEEWLPTSPGASAMEGRYDEVWRWIGTRAPFDNHPPSAEHIDNGAGLSWYLTSEPGGTVLAEHFLTISPVLVGSQVCDAEQLIDLPGDGSEVIVRYDPRFIADESEPNYLLTAENIAKKIRDRAKATRIEYRDQLDFTIADRLTISIECELFFRGIIPAPAGTPAVTDAHDQIHIRSDWLYNHFKTPDANTTYASWAQVVDHEIFHTIQGSGTAFGDLDAGVKYLWEGNRSIAESSAQMAQDLMAATDDADKTGIESSYLAAANAFIADPVSVDTDHPGDGREYLAAGFIQYMGERFGPLGGTIEERVAAFLRLLNFESPSREAGYQIAMIKGGRSGDLWLEDAIRDYLITTYSHSAPNLDAAENADWRMLDEKTPHGAAQPAAGEQQDYRDVTVAQTPLGQHFAMALQETGGDIAEVTLPGSPSRVEVTIDSSGFTPALTVAVIPVTGNGSVTIDGPYMGREDLFNPIRINVDTTGATRLAIVIVCASSDPCSAGIDTRDISAAPRTPSDGAHAASQSATSSVPAMTLTVGSAGSAGNPLNIITSVTDGSTPILKASAIATVTGPTGIVRRFPLRDDGGSGEGGWHDGTYGVRAFATALPGTYQVRVDVTGTNAGQPFAIQASQPVVLTPIVDQDGDTIADLVEPLVGSNPSIADGTTDVDRDGLTLATELTQGTNPFRADTDRSGESDSSEVAAGRDPRSPVDDAAVSSPLLSAEPADGLRVRVDVAAVDATSSVRVQRKAISGTTDLGLRPGSGSTFLDGPLPAGSYEYIAWVETSGGVRSTPVSVGPVTVVSDATPPAALIQVNGGSAATNSSTIGVLFVDLTEPVSSMRIAESEGALDAAPWVPFATSSQFALSPGDGFHSVIAQVRDAAGNVSAPAYAVATVDTVAPTSQASTIAPFVNSPTVNLSFVATDDATGVDRVETWQRYRATAAGTWSAWTLIGQADTSPVGLSLASGDGIYELATVAIDRAGNREGLVSADTSTTLDQAPPTSSASSLPATSSGPSIAIPYTAADVLAGVASVELWARYRLTPTGAWGSWTLASTATVSPISYSFAQGNGYYEFYTIATDRSGNREAAPAAADASTQRVSGDTSPPTAPTALTATAAAWNRVNLAWTASTDNVEVTRYTVSRGGVPIAVVTGTVTTFIDRSVVQSTAYQYSVTASDAAGNSSAASNTSTATTPSYVASPDSTPPSVPTGVTASMGAPTSIGFRPVIVSWTGSTDNTVVTSYTVLRNGIGIGTLDATEATGTFADRSVNPATTYAYSVRATDGSGNVSASSSTVSITTPTCCTAIRRPSADVQNSGFVAKTGSALYSQLNEAVSDGDWTYITGPLAKAGFAIVRVGAVTGYPAVAVNSVRVQYSARTFVTSGTTGIVKVRSELYRGSILIGTGITRTLGNGYATFTDTYSIAPATILPDLRVKLTQISASTKAASRFSWLEVVETFTPTDTTAPSQPQGLTVTGVSDRQVNLSWSPSTDANGVQGYLVLREGVKVAATIGGTTYRDIGRTPGATYHYTVQAIDGSGNTSALSGMTAVATTSAAPPPPVDSTPPSVPTWGTTTAVSPTRVNLSWNASSDAVGVQGYWVYREGVKVGTVVVGSTTFSDTGLTPATTYHYTLQAVDGSGNTSGQGAASTATTPP